MDLTVSPAQSLTLLGLALVVVGAVYLIVGAWGYHDRTRYGPAAAIITSLVVVGLYALQQRRSLAEGVLDAVLVGAAAMGLYDLGRAVGYRADEPDDAG